MAYTSTDAFDRAKNKLETRIINFYDFFLGSQTETDGDTHHFVSFYKNIDFFNYPESIPTTYMALGITRGPSGRETSMKVPTMELSVCNVNDAMAAWAADKDFRGKRVIVRLGFRDKLDNADNVKIVWDGKINQIAFDSSKKTMTASLVSKFGTLNYKTGRKYRIQCPWQFGRSLCQVNRNSSVNKVTGTATGGSTTTLIDTNVLTQADDHWNHGYIGILGGGALGGQKRLIKDFDQATRTLYFYYALPSTVVAGVKYVVYRGCDKTLNTCENTYNNEGNFGGFHTIPLRSDY